MIVHVESKDAERQAAAALAKSGKLERAIAAFTALNVKAPETRAQTYAAEVDALGALFRCDEVRELAATIDARGDAAAKAAAESALEECARVAQAPSEPAEAQMRGIFHRAGDFEPIEPRDAGVQYAQAWEIAPSLAALLGLARTAKMRGDAALAERTYERALAYVERGGQKARVAIGPIGLQSDPVSVLDVGDTSALAAFGSRLVTLDLKTGALRVVASVPLPWSILAGHGDRVVIARDGHASLMRVGTDDARTSTPTELGSAVTVFSPDGALVAQVAHGDAIVIDARTSKTLGHTPLRDPDADVVGFTDGHALVVSKSTELCTMAAPDWSCISSKDLGRNTRRAASIAGHMLAFQPNANTFVVFDLAKKNVVTTLQGNFSSVNELVLSPNASSLFSLSVTRTVVWDLTTKKRDDRIFTHTRPYFTPDGRAFVERGINALLVRDGGTLVTNVPLAVGAFPMSDPRPEVAFEPDGRLIVRSTYDTARIDLARRTVVWTAHNFETTGPLLASVTSPDKKWTVSVADGLIHASGPNANVTIDFGPDAAVFTDESGHASVIGNDASVRCVVDDAWLPLDACRDRLVRE